MRSTGSHVILNRELKVPNKKEIIADLYEKYYDKVARYVFARTGDRMLSEDLASDVFVRALKSVDSYKERGLPIEAWLFKIAHNLVIDYYRKKGREAHLESEPASGDDVEEITERDMEIDRITKAMEKLTPAQREVIGLRIFSELSSVEAGKIMGKTPGAVRELQSQALKTLRQILGKDG